jgi:superfamily II DNA/RNA helicase
MVRAQTGTGKTAAFALPLLQKLLTKEVSHANISVLVLTPTRELAQQVYKNFCEYSQFTDIKTAVVHGGVSTKQQISQLNNGVDVLVATPGRLLDLINSDHVDLAYITTLVFDEADRILDLGFKDEIELITAKLPLKKQTLLFSATFVDQIYLLSKNILESPSIIEIDNKNTVANNIQQTIYAVDDDRKRELTSFLIGSKNWQRVLVFTRTKQSADFLAKEMTKDGIKSAAIHGDKSQGARDKALKQFKEGSIRALVATDVAARGLDIKNLFYVINYELPYNAEDYVHRIGRTARAGDSGLAVSLVTAKEEWLLKAIEELLEITLLQEWLPGYEPDLTKVAINDKKSMSTKKARKRAISRTKNGRNKNR